jgi:hypothetical protein
VHAELNYELSKKIDPQSTPTEIKLKRELDI